MQHLSLFTTAYRHISPNSITSIYCGFHKSTLNDIETRVSTFKCLFVRRRWSSCRCIR